MIGYKLLAARADFQELALASVFAEFPQQIKDWRYETEDATNNLRLAFDEQIKKNVRLLGNLTDRLSPLRLAAKLNEKKTRLAILRQKQIAAIKNVVGAKDENLKIAMASLDALSPLSVLRRGFSIVESESGEILRDAAKLKKGEKLKIKLAKGELEAQVLDIRN